jgi:hypothetical protein
MASGSVQQIETEAGLMICRKAEATTKSQSGCSKCKPCWLRGGFTVVPDSWLAIADLLNPFSQFTYLIIETER